MNLYTRQAPRSLCPLYEGFFFVYYMKTLALLVVLTSGRFYINVGGEDQAKWYGTRHTAEAAAINAAFSCACTVIIKQPEIKISIMEGDKTATVSWSAPTARENGAVLNADEIDHYLVAALHNNVTTIKKVIKTTANYENLAVGEYVFKVAAVDKNGVISDYSDSASKVIR